MQEKKKLIYVFNIFRSSAVANIVRDIQPYIWQHYDVHLVALQPISDDAYLSDEFRQIGITIHALDCPRLNVPLASLRLRHFLKELKPDVVHAHAGRAAMLVPFCIPRGTPVFVTYHNVLKGHGFATRNVLRYTSRLLNGSTGVSRTVADSWKSLGVRDIRTIYNPIDFSLFYVWDSEVATIREEFAVADGTPLLVNVGRLVHQKAQDVLLDSIQKLGEIADRNFLLVIAGRGPLEQQLKQQAKTLGIEDRVYFAGFRTDVPALLAAADVFVFPSRWEGLPVAGLEAMASGTAIVTSDVDSMQECISDGETGLLTPVEDACALASNTKRLLEDAKLRDQLIAAAGVYVREVASPEGIAQQYLALYAGQFRKPGRTVEQFTG